MNWKEKHQLGEFIKGLKRLGWLRTEMQSFTDEALEKQWKEDHYVLDCKDD